METRARQTWTSRADWNGCAGGQAIPTVRGIPFYMGLLFAAPFLIVPPTGAQVAQAKNVILLGHNNLNGHGDGGEGMAIQARPNGRWILYLAHEGTQYCISIVDVTNPRDPVLVNELPSPNPGITRCNSLGLSGTVLAVADQTNHPGQQTAGMWVLDVSNLARIRKAKRLQDLALSFFDTPGLHSRGVRLRAITFRRAGGSFGGRDAAGPLR